MHAQLGKADNTAQAMRDCMVNMQREVVKPNLALEVRKAYIDLTKSFTTSLVQHHAGQGSVLVGAIDSVLNGAGAVTPRRSPGPREPAPGKGRQNRRR